MEYHTVFFGDNKYRRLLNALRRSVERNTSNSLIVHEIRNERRRGPVKLTTNSMKLEKWGDIVRNASDNIVLLDCDTVVLKDVSHVFEKDFDIAYTRRSPEMNIPINGGVVFVKPGEKSMKFFDRWVEVNTRMMKDRRFHLPWQKRYAGINQSAFGYLLENDPGVNMLELKCEDYNACDPVNWNHLNGAHILHVKSELQYNCFYRTPRAYHKAVQMWKKYDK